MFDRHTHKHIDFQPDVHLRVRTRNFIIDDKVVATKDTFEYKHPEYGWWNTVDNHTETVYVKDENELWDNHNLKVKA